MVLSQIQNIAVNGAGNSKAGLIAGLRQLSNTPEQRGKLILAVEGDNDIRFYGRFLNPDKITIHQSRGCRKVTMELRNLTPMQLSLVRSFLIVILDADGIRLPGVTPKPMPDMVFRTDTRDWETTVMRDMPLSDFWTITLAQQAETLDLGKHLLDPLYIWSCTAAHCFIRQYVHGINASANMSGFDWSSHTGLSLADTLTAIKRMPPNIKDGRTKSGVDEALQESEIDQLLLSYTNVSPWDLHRGHNLVKGLCHRFMQVTRRQKKEKDMTILLADSFPPEKFRATVLARNLENYLRTRGVSNIWKT